MIASIAAAIQELDAAIRAHTRVSIGFCSLSASRAEVRAAAHRAIVAFELANALVDSNLKEPANAE